jgi:diadenylate cyclase
MFLNFGIKDAIDILLVALLLYYAYRVMKVSRSLYVFNGIVLFVLVWLIVSQILEMRLLGNIMGQLINVGVIGLIILFQEDVRKFLYGMGSHRRIRRMSRMLGIGGKTEIISKESIMPIVMACLNMARQRVGALIVVEKSINIDDVVATGDVIDARIDQRLIENIFFKNSPLHDGALIISKKRIKAAGCILPVSHDMDIPREFGLRHRAALGISQESDALAIVVSEETGRITAAENGKFRVRLSAEELESILTEN